MQMRAARNGVMADAAAQMLLPGCTGRWEEAFRLSVPLSARIGQYRATCRHGRRAVIGLRRHPVSWATTSSIGRTERSPVARSVSSAPPAASERGEMVTVHGMPSSSASVSFTPGDSSRSS